MLRSDVWRAAWEECDDLTSRIPESAMPENAMPVASSYQVAVKEAAALEAEATVHAAKAAALEAAATEAAEKAAAAKAAAAKHKGYLRPSSAECQKLLVPEGPSMAAGPAATFDVYKGSFGVPHKAEGSMTAVSEEGSGSFVADLKPDFRPVGGRLDSIQSAGDYQESDAGTSRVPTRSNNTAGPLLHQSSRTIQSSQSNPESQPTGIDDDNAPLAPGPCDRLKSCCSIM
jgi:hypothetical protein